MSSFSPLRFREYARDLSEAIDRLSKENMGATSELRSYLGDDQATVRFGLSKKIITSNGKTIEVSQDATNAEVAQALKDAGSKMTDPLPPVEIGPAALPAPVDDARTSNITGLQSGAFQDALVQMRKRIADKQRQAVNIIAGAVASGEAKIDAVANEVAAKVDKEISAAIQEFAQHTNGGPV